MNAATITRTTATASNPSAANGLRRMLQTLRAELRRALELAGAPYKDGMLPPL